MTKINKLSNTKIELENETSAEKLELFFNKKIAEASKNIEIAGFRKGKAPMKVVRQQLGDSQLLSDAALDIIDEEFRDFIVKEKMRPIGRPDVQIKKLALGNPLLYTITIDIIPEFSLANYKEIAVKYNTKETSKKDLEVKDEEVEAVLMEIRKSKQTEEDRKNNVVPGELTDEDAKTLANLGNISELKEKIKENMEKEKLQKVNNKKRVEMVEELVKETNIELPEKLIESELDRMTAEFQSEIEKMGGKMEDYLAEIKKTKEDLRKEWRVDAEKRAKLQVILNKIADTEKLELDEAKVKREVEHLKTHYKDADEENIRIYVETILLNEKVFAFLESQKQ
jgi:trigger factor